MLISLNINNIALIDECRLKLGNGLNIMSGETGAGKSIIIDALSFVLGCRADKSLIRFGEDKATVEAVFDINNTEVFSVMEELGIVPDNTLIIKRAMTDTRNEIRVNGEQFTIAMLKKITALLVDILGQHEHQSLLKASNHIILLDKFAGADALNLKNEVKILYNDYKKTLSEINELGNASERTMKLDILKYQIEEIEKAELKEGEEDELLIAREKYRNSEKIITSVVNSHNAMDSSEISVVTALSAAYLEINTVANYDEVLEEFSARLESAKIELKDIADSLKDYAESFEYDEHRANLVEQRVDTIKMLKRKYGGSLEEVLASLELFKTQYDELSNAEEKLESLTKKLEDLTIALFNKAMALSKVRRTAAQKFENKISAELNDLAMKNTMFKINFSDIPEIENLETEISSDGFDKVDFLISPNAGEPLKPLAKIASGGEMSRIMLALQSILAELDGIETLVFDEIDTGISGHVAKVVAEKLNGLSKTKQIIAVTHLPQLASYADNHYLISKRVAGNKTITELDLLGDENQITEIVRLSGGAGSEISRMHAKELLLNAKKNKIDNY